MAAAKLSMATWAASGWEEQIRDLMRVAYVDPNVELEIAVRQVCRSEIESFADDLRPLEQPALIGSMSRAPTSTALASGIRAEP